MLAIFLLFLIYIFPQIKPTCKKATPCAEAFNCACQNKQCTCYYYDENDELRQIKCELNND